MKARILVAALGFAALVPPSAGAQASAAARAAPAMSLAERVETILEAALGEPDARAEPIAQALHRLGSRAMPELFAALGKRIPAAGDHESAPSLQCRALEQALCHMPMPILHGYLERAAETALAPEMRVAMVRVLSQCGSALDLTLLVALAGPVSDGGEDGDATDRSAAFLRRAVTTVLLRDPRGYGMIENTLRGQALAVQSALLSAVADTGSDVGLKFLARLLERHSTLRLFVLNLMGRMAPHVSRPVDELVLAEVRNALIERDAEVLPEVILLCGHFDDFDAAPHLVSMVDDHRRNVSANAIWALQRMTGLSFRDDSERWRTWLDTEMGWWREAAPHVLKNLVSADPTVVRKALLEIAKQHTFRHQLADDVVRAVEASGADIVALACSTLGQLDSKVAVPFLVDRLEHADAGVRANALASLCKITRMNVQGSADAWRRALAATARPDGDRELSSQ